MKRFDAKMVITCTEEQKEAVRRMAGGERQVSQFMRFLMMQMAVLNQDKAAADAFGEEFAEGIKGAVEKMVNEAVAKQVHQKKK
jgi:ABC-type iron transport system FetAB ATPase subunit